MALKKNDFIELSVTGMTAEGMGVGHFDGMAVFVPLTAPGDLAQVKIVKVLKNLAYGRLEQLLSPSPDRIEPDCPVFAQCGGCCYQ
ncbi:MAG: TRAM domain-containing protein, partial [Acutalibacter sp.]|nr:TRAM domain-containing protein [Acutalibacter sp.]